MSFIMIARRFLDRRCVMLETCIIFASFFQGSLPLSWKLTRCLLIFFWCSFGGHKQFFAFLLQGCLARLLALLLWHLGYSFNYIYFIILSTDILGMDIQVNGNTTPIPDDF
ncbi:hypothetical protein FGO68_gene13330 [Halteria grandinella]|uniref:Uncharacterized protein n=1 Tax=Halteria grandinella TaxID=5974 RepID=A0A8J8T2V9_HALGN|nr:hypothetical protein FGO68_gene13330 [Halteria grandinella]